MSDLYGVVEIFWHNWSDSRPHTTNECVSRFFCDNWRFQHSKQTEIEDFYMKTQIEKTAGRERSHYGLKNTMNSSEYSCVYNFSDVIPFLDGCPRA